LVEILYYFGIFEFLVYEYVEAEGSSVVRQELLGDIGEFVKLVKFGLKG
jgi:hypothetical protein